MAKKSSISSGAVKGTWEYNGSYSTQRVTSGKTPYETYFSVVKGILSNTENTALVTVYADSNKNGSFDSTDIVIGDATTKTYVAGTSGTKGTFVGSLKSNVTYSYVGNKRVGEATFNNSAWSPAQANNMLGTKSSRVKRVGKDSVTGLSMVFDGVGRLASDRVYSIGGWEVEGELSNNYYVVTRTQQTSEGRETRRAVYEGEFGYKNGIMNSANVRSVWFFRVGESSSGIDMVGRVAKPLETVVKNLRQESSWSSLDSNSTDISYFASSNGVVAEGSIDDFVNYNNGRFYPEGWWGNPFATNLL